MKPTMSRSLVVILLLVGSFQGALLYSAATAGSRFRPTTELITAAHRILDLGYDCHASGAERAACHAQLTTAISQRLRQ